MTLSLSVPLSPLEVATCDLPCCYCSNLQGGSNGVKKCDMEDPNVGESIIGFKMDINNMQCYHIE